MIGKLVERGGESCTALRRYHADGQSWLLVRRADGTEVSWPEGEVRPTTMAVPLRDAKVGDEVKVVSPSRRSGIGKVIELRDGAKRIQMPHGETFWLDENGIFIPRPMSMAGPRIRSVNKAVHELRPGDKVVKWQSGQPVLKEVAAEPTWDRGMYIIRYTDGTSERNNGIAGISVQVMSVPASRANTMANEAAKDIRLPSGFAWHNDGAGLVFPVGAGRYEVTAIYRDQQPSSESMGTLDSITAALRFAATLIPDKADVVWITDRKRGYVVAKGRA